MRRCETVSYTHLDVYKRQDQIKAAPELNSSVDASFITGIGSVKTGQGEKDSERMLILMDIEGLMSSADMGLLND